MATLFEIFLKNILVKENGRIDEHEEGVNALSATLHYPREGQPALVSVRDLALQDDERLDYTEEEFLKQLLFKEVVKGRSMMTIEITAKEKVDKFDKLIRKIFGKAVAAAAKALPGGPIVTAVVSAASKTVFGQADEEDKIHVIAGGWVLINENTPDGDLVVQLEVPEEVVVRQSKRKFDGSRTITKMTLPQGMGNAEVVFNVQRTPQGGPGLVAE
jgi:hypothetical protein